MVPDDLVSRGLDRGRVGGLYVLYLLRLKQVTSQVRVRMEARFDERERIARDLHDTLLQSIQGLIMKFHALARQVPAGEVRQGMDNALDYADQTLTEGRERVRNLRGADDALSDLSAAFQRVAKEASPERAANVKIAGRLCAAIKSDGSGRVIFYWT